MVVKRNTVQMFFFKLWLLLSTLGFIAHLPLAFSSPEADAPFDAPVREATDELTVQWLKKMDAALVSPHFTGELVHRIGLDERRIVVRHAIFETKPYLRISQTAGQSEFIRRGDELICLHPNESVESLEQMAFVEPRHFAQLAARFASLTPFYKFSLELNGGRVAGRETVLIDIQARDPFRYHRRLWLDRQSALVTKGVVLSGLGEVLEQFEFVSFDPEASLSLNDFTLVLPRTNPGSEGADEAATARPRLSPFHWRLDWLPPGFFHARQQLHKLPNKPKQIESVMYSDGFASFSVFLEVVVGSQGEQTWDTLRLPSVRQGATLTHSRMVVLNQGQQDSGEAQSQGDHSAMVTIVGDIPSDVAERVLAAFRSE